MGLAGKGGWRERDRAARVQTWLHHPVEVAYSLQHGRLPGRRQVVRDSLSNAARHPVELILQTCGTSLGGAELVQVLRKSVPPGGEKVCKTGLGRRLPSAFTMGLFMNIFMNMNNWDFILFTP